MNTDFLSKYIYPRTLIKKIGQGAFGTVYEIGNLEDDTQPHQALKIINIPLAEIREDIDSDENTLQFRDYKDELLSQALHSIELLTEFSSSPYFVKILDHQVVEETDNIYILEWMPLYRPLTQYILSNVLYKKDVIRLGLDLSSALSELEKRNILHRDIKPGNVFVAEDGHFLLGDFDIATRIDSSGQMGNAGTYQYMAPEMSQNKPYDARIDIYSLGITLYRYLNNDRLPLMPMEGAIRHSDLTTAVTQRMEGTPLPLPFFSKDMLGKIVCKACSYLPQDRYQNAEKLKKALKKAQSSAFFNGSLNQIVLDKVVASQLTRDDTTTISYVTNIPSSLTHSVWMEDTICPSFENLGQKPSIPSQPNPNDNQAESQKHSSISPLKQFEYKSKIWILSERLFQTMLIALLKDYLVEKSDDHTWENGLFKICTEKIKSNKKAAALFSYNEYRKNYLSKKTPDLLSTIDITFAYALLENEWKNVYKGPDYIFKKIMSSLANIKDRNRNELVHGAVRFHQGSPDFLSTAFVSLDNIIRFIDSLRSLMASTDFLWDSFPKEVTDALNSYYAEANNLIKEITQSTVSTEEPSPLEQSQSNFSEAKTNEIHELEKPSITIMKASKSLILYKLAEVLSNQGKNKEAEGYLRQALEEFDTENQIS